ncbi:MAG TPA: RDD family protein [Acidobacteriaceae bacterium]|nr:RDD family protein [Acidobacteriaceae bacterium]
MAVSMQSALEQGEGERSEALLATGTEGPASLREEVAQRVAAHRNRRAGAQAMEAERDAAMRRRQESMVRESRRGAALVRDAVRARYETSPSYREFLAAEAERALQQAQAEAEVATRNARAVAEAQLQLLEELEQWNEPQPGPREQAIAAFRDEARGELAHALADLAMGAQELIAEPPLLTVVEQPAPAVFGDLFPEEAAPKTEVSAGGLTVKLYEDLGPARVYAGDEARWGAAYGVQPEATTDELEELEQEIEFRRAPEFHNHILETLPLPANLIEFPRQLIAPRKARPRLAEGPLREDAAAEPQLRIFEVEAEQISTEPAGAAEEMAAGSPDWQGLVLESAPAVHQVRLREVQQQAADPVAIATVGRRLMAAVVDGCCIGTACLGFATVVAYLCGAGLQALSAGTLIGSGVVVFLVAGLLYELLFFSFAGATPGMLYARIGLCTFADENPSRKAMRRRVWATMLAACPLGLGLLWVWMDDDRLGWHDRMSRMYQRAY